MEYKHVPVKKYATVLQLNIYHIKEPQKKIMRSLSDTEVQQNLLLSIKQEE